MIDISKLRWKKLSWEKNCKYTTIKTKVGNFTIYITTRPKDRFDISINFGEDRGTFISDYTVLEEKNIGKPYASSFDEAVYYSIGNCINFLEEHKKFLAWHHSIDKLEQLRGTY